MRNTRTLRGTSRRADQRCALVIDYENLFDRITRDDPDDTHPDELIIRLLDEVSRFIKVELGAKVTIAEAFADFSLLERQATLIQRDLVEMGVDPRFISSDSSDNAIELSLCLRASEALLGKPDVDIVLIVSGDRQYEPLQEFVEHQGKRAIVATLHPRDADREGLVCGRVIDARIFLEEPADGAGSDTSGIEMDAPREPVQYQDISDQIALETLEIIERHFGQYEEVYLTPLLRKLSEQLDESEHDPKTIVNGLEEAGAVWLEKRRGHPYDYTVLLVDSGHPNVQQIQDMILDEVQDDVMDIDTYPYDTVAPSEDRLEAAPAEEIYPQHPFAANGISTASGNAAKSRSRLYNTAR